MDALEIVAKKRDGYELSRDEVDMMINGYVAGEIPDYQMSAFLMAVYIRGMTSEETYALTRSMIAGGDIVSLEAIKGIKIDKHSTGGVGDKITLIFAPLMAAVGLKVAKMSGRGLGHTGGTLDKLESIPGFSIDLTARQFVEQVNKIGIAVMGQTSEICPADKKLYALRDATATISSIPLITSSIMSKKFAGGADVIVFDVKVGSGAFMKTTVQAKVLAGEMMATAEKFKKRAVAVISNMDQPLGSSVGNSLEVQEAIDTLKGFGAPDVLELCFTIGTVMMKKAGIVENASDAVDILTEKIENGDALNKFKVFVEAQGGDSSCVDNPRSVLPHAKFVEDYQLSVDGFIGKINAEKIGIAARVLGAGRERKEEAVDHSAGIVITHKVGEYVHAGDTILEMHSNNAHRMAVAREIVDDAIHISREPHEVGPVVYDIID